VDDACAGGGGGHGKSFESPKTTTTTTTIKRRAKSTVTKANPSKVIPSLSLLKQRIEGNECLPKCLQPVRHQKVMKKQEQQ
jgi:hypothetical protein